MIRKVFLTIVVLTLSLHSVLSQSKHENEAYKQYIGSSFFMLGNLLPEPPNFYLLNYGYRITSKDVVSIEAKTWEYPAPLGIPYGSDWEKKRNNFPGYVKAFGVGLVYKRFLWKKLFGSIQSTAFYQKYMAPNKEKIQGGFQLYNTLRLGYQFNFFKNRFFIEPSFAFNYWPIHTHLPKSFQDEEDKWPNYFLFEPGLHFGVNF